MKTSKLAAAILMLLTVFPVSAKGDKTSVDSLVNEAVELASHGKFEQSDSICEAIVGNLSKQQKKYVYGIMATNADLSGRYGRMSELLELCDAGPAIKKYARTLAALPPQSVYKPSADVTIPYLPDSLFYGDEFKGCSIRVPAEFGQKSVMAILDNGCAKFSFASETFAKTHGITPIELEGTANGVVDSASMHFGVCDSLSVGSMVFRNVVFVILPDSAMDNPVTKIDVILGSNVLRLAGEIVFDNRKRTVTFPSVQEEREPNLSYINDGLQYLNVTVGCDTLLLQLDTGAARTSLNSRYCKEFKSKVESEGTLSETTRGGIGGFVKESVYVMQDIAFSACGGTFVRKTTFVSIGEDVFSRNSYGSLGADFLLSFDRAVLNVEKMYLCVSGEPR